MIHHFGIVSPFLAALFLFSPLAVNAQAPPASPYRTGLIESDLILPASIFPAQHRAEIRAWLPLSGVKQIHPAFGLTSPPSVSA